MVKVQSRSEEHGIKYCESIFDAFEEAKKDDSIWKISILQDNYPSARFVRIGDSHWKFEPIIIDVNEILNEKEQQENKL